VSDVVILMPFRSDEGRRHELMSFTRDWLRRRHPRWQLVLGESPDGPFNRGAAINDAARKAYQDWTVAVVHDSDNISDPATLERAVERAYEKQGCVFPFETYFYLDEYTSDRLMNEGNFFVSPIRQPWGMSREHCSGIQAISRVAYDQVGGFPELEGWGSEDWVMNIMLKAFTSGTEHLPGSALHLYHCKSDGSDPEMLARAANNRQILADVMALSVVPEQLREYLKAGGHPIP
jgi:hypothetical protein